MPDSIVLPASASGPWGAAEGTRKPGPERTKPASARKGASGLSASGGPLSADQPNAVRPVSAAQRARAGAAARAAAERAGSSSGRNVVTRPAPLPIQAESRPSTKTTWAPAALIGRVLSIFGQGSATP